MARLILREPVFFSYLDEESFYLWLKKLEGVESFSGTKDGLEISIKPNIEEGDLRDLLAWLTRYGLERRALRSCRNASNERWFADRGAYWYASVFEDK